MFQMVFLIPVSLLRVFRDTSVPPGDSPTIARLLRVTRDTSVPPGDFPTIARRWRVVRDTSVPLGFLTVRCLA